MALYKISNQKIQPIKRTTFAQQKVRERDDLQEMLKAQIEVVSPDTLIVAEEFGDWEDSRRRIDLLGVDKDANLVVIELKRTEDGGHMELQGIRYAAMISTLTFERLVPIYSAYLKSNNIDIDPVANLLEFLDWSEPDEDKFAQGVRIVLASAEFSKELTTSVMWLNEFNLDIRCVRLRPYADNGETYLDVQTVIPLREVADYQIRVRDKKQKEREARSSNRDFTKYDLSIAGKKYEGLSKRWLMFRVVSEIINAGHHPDEIAPAFAARKFKVFDGELNAENVYEQIMDGDQGGTVARADRFFTKEGEFFRVGGKTYVLSNQWGKYTLPNISDLNDMFPDLEISLKASKE